MFSFMNIFSGSLMTRNLSGLVTANDLIPRSDYMQSVLFVIPELEEKNWLNEYESLLPLGAVPRSARALCRDDGQVLYVVVLMKKFIDDFIQAAGSKKFIARTDFQIDSEQQNQETEALSKLEADVKNQWVIFLLILILIENFNFSLL